MCQQRASVLSNRYHLRLLISTLLQYFLVTHTDYYVGSYSVSYSSMKFELMLMTGVLGNLSAMMFCIPFV